ncbi:putative ribonuclease H-like domain-containing protein [Tanacetum coccineum]
MTHFSPKRNMVPKAVLMRSGLVSLTTARPFNTAQPKTIVNITRPMTNVFNKVHSIVRRPINNKTTTKNSNFNKRVNTVSGMNVITAMPKAVVNVARPKAVLNAIKGNQGNPQIDLQDQGVIDNGCSRHMTWNMSNLTDFEEIDGGYIAFGGNPKGGKITGISTIKTDHLGKFNGKADEGFFVGYSLNSKAFRVFNSRTRIVEENMHIRFSESTPNVVGTKASDNADPRSSHDDGSKPSSDDGKKVDEDPRKDSECNDQDNEDNVNITNNVNDASTNEVNAVGGKTTIKLPYDPNMPDLEDDSIFDFSRNDEYDGAMADMNNLDTTIQVSPIPTTRIHKYHPLDQVIGDLQSATQTRKMSKNLKEHGFISTIQQRTNHKDLQNYLFACFLSQEEPKKVIHALKDPS